MRVCFVLPQMLRKPIGGYKIVYEYANRLIERGYDISLFFLNDNALTRFHIPKCVRKFAIYYFTKYGPKWFELNPNIKKISSTEGLSGSFFKSFDIVFATGSNTVYKTDALFSECRKAFFIQGHETWLYSEDELNRMYALGFENIVISTWLKELVDKCSSFPALLISNPIDLNKYKIKIKVYDRDKYSIGVLYHNAVHKGFSDAYKAIKKVKEKYPQVTLHMFGTSKPDFILPEWVTFILNASQDETINLYNKVSVFACATISEGYGLTGLEAMACGCALASTDYLGVKEYAVDKYNSLLSPVHDTDALVQNIIDLIENDDLRYAIVNNGLASTKDYSWDSAIGKLTNFLNNDLNP